MLRRSKPLAYNPKGCWNTALGFIAGVHGGGALVGAVCGAQNRGKTGNRAQAKAPAAAAPRHPETLKRAEVFQITCIHPRRMLEHGVGLYCTCLCRWSTRWRGGCGWKSTKEIGLLVFGKRAKANELAGAAPRHPETLKRDEVFQITCLQPQMMLEHGVGHFCPCF